MYRLDGYKVKSLPAFSDIICGTAPDYRPIDSAMPAAVANAITHPDGRAMDVYRLGVLAYLIFTGEAPAADLEDLNVKLQSGGLDAASVTDGLPDDLVTLIQISMTPIAQRIGS